MTVPVRIYDKSDYAWESEKFRRAFTTGTRDGLGIEFKWHPQSSIPMHHGAPVFGVGVGSTRYVDQVKQLGNMHPSEVDVGMLLRLKQRPSRIAPSEFSLTIAPNPGHT